MERVQDLNRSFLRELVQVLGLIFSSGLCSMPGHQAEINSGPELQLSRESKNKDSLKHLYPQPAMI